jgi:hypothetical protein
VIKKYLQEPLLHFLVLGGLLFLFYAYVNDGFTQEDKKIVISQAKQNQLIYIWQKKHMQKPTKIELQELIEGEIYAQIMSREAVKLGLDKEDGIIRRRLVQKMTFVSSNLSTLVNPTETQLKKHLQEHKEKFMSSVRISFTLQNNVMLNRENKSMSKWEVSRIYGKAFTDKVFTLPIGVWSKNMMSAYGKVDVYVKEIISASALPYVQIKPTLKADWQRAQKERLEQKFYETLKSDYSIKIEE